MKINRGRAMELYSILNHVEYQEPISNRFSYMVSVIVKRLQEEIDAINIAYPEPEIWVNAMKERAELLKKYALTDPRRTTDIADEEKKNAFQAEWNEFLTRSKPADEAYAAFDKERNVFLGEEIELNLITITDDLIPKYTHPEWDKWDIWNIIMTIVVEESAK